MQLEVVHKKVRLSEDLLAWEHERFSMKRLPAATLSSLSNHKQSRVSSIFTPRWGIVFTLGSIISFLSLSLSPLSLSLDQEKA